MFFALLRPNFTSRYTRAKMCLNRAQNIFMPANINVLYCCISFNQSYKSQIKVIEGIQIRYVFRFFYRNILPHKDSGVITGN